MCNYCSTFGRQKYTYFVFFVNEKEIKKGLHRWNPFVGVARLERATACTPCRRVKAAHSAVFQRVTFLHSFSLFNNSELFAEKSPDRRGQGKPFCQRNDGAKIWFFPIPTTAWSDIATPSARSATAPHRSTGRPSIGTPCRATAIRGADGGRRSRPRPPSSSP